MRCRGPIWVSLLMRAVLILVLSNAVCFAFASTFEKGSLSHISAYVPPSAQLKPIFHREKGVVAAKAPMFNLARTSPAIGSASRHAKTALQLRKIDRVRAEGNNNEPEKPKAVTELSQMAQGATRSTYQRKEPGIVDAAAEVRNWMLRSELGRDDGEDRRMEEIVAEFAGVEEDAEMYSTDEAELSGWSRFKKSADRDIDPSGVLAQASENIQKAEAMNMSYVSYVAKYLQKPNLPTVDVIFPSNRTLPSGQSNLVTTAHSFPVFGLLERVPWSTCWYGLFFEVEAKGRAVEVTGLWTQTGMYFEDVRDKMDVRLYSREGGAQGFETSPDAWTLVGEEKDCRMQRVNFTLNSNPGYGRLPLDAPLHIKAGETRGFALVTSRDRGIVLRASEMGSFIAGEVSDEDAHLTVKTGLLPCGMDDLHDTALKVVYHPLNAAAFVGVIDYRLLPEETEAEEEETGDSTD